MMIRRRSGRLSASAMGMLVVAATTALGGLATADSASAVTATPRWAVTTVSKPTNLQPETPRTQVERLTVDATGGTFAMSVVLGAEIHTTTQLPYNASAVEVEAALNAFLNEHNAGVTVTGGPGGASPYEIEWSGRPNRALPEVGINDVSVETAGLTGGAHTATLATVVEGAEFARLVVKAINVGGATDGSTITLGDVLPPGLTATEVSGEEMYRKESLSCSASPSPSCSYEGAVSLGDSFEMTIVIAVAGGLPAAVTNEASVSGGGAEPVSAGTPLRVSSAPDSFGVAPGSLVAAVSTSQAGAHPDVTTSFALNAKGPFEPVSTPKDVLFDLPVGLVGNTVGMPRCSMRAVMRQTEEEELCPSGSMVGMATLTLREATIIVPVYNIPPAPGEPAAFGFDAEIVPVRLDTTVLSNGDNRVRVTASELNEAEPVIGSTITIWGVPADHDGPGPDRAVFGQLSFGGPSAAPRVPLLTNPQQCSQPLDATAKVDSWSQPGQFVPAETVGLGTLEGCDQLRLSASFSMLPDTLEAGAPAGFDFDLDAPQNNSPDGLGTPNVKKVTLALPLGAVVNPSAAWGLKACSNAQFYGPDHPSQEPASLAECPREAQVGTVRVKTPALEEGLVGQVYLGEPECNPCTPADAEDGKMVRLFVQAVSEGEGGIVVKLEGHGKVDQQTGQITTTFDNNPQLPFSEFKLTLSGGPRAVLANPRTCGPATSIMDLTPWSAPTTPDVTPSSTFEIDQNCFGPLFNPSFLAGSPNIQAGAYTPFTLAFGRSDHDEYLRRLSLSMPPGLLGKVASVPLCKEPQAAQGTCGADSLIGHVQVLTGPGANPYLVSGGQVFLTESYEGAPYGLSIVVPAVAGPYTLSGTTGQGTVVVRSKIEVDPTDAHLTVTSDSLPTMLDGIPLQLQGVNVSIDRPGFTFNPTSCAKKAIGATLSSDEGMSKPESSSFQVANCASLKFPPKFTADTAGVAKGGHVTVSKANGVSLHVKVTYPDAPFGTQANIAKVKVELPKALPSRLTTLQRACAAKVFEANPANCPAESVVGHATAVTPVLPVALNGPAYFVSHGGEAFPSLIVVLQGYGVTVDLVGATFISHAGITSSTFNQVPDVPIASFDLTLPEGKYSALTANLPASAKGDFCTQKLTMPTVFTAQNGAVVDQSTPISVAGCSKAKSLTRAQKLAKALKACKKKPKGKRAACQRQARKKYAPVRKKAKKK
jgi:hypothetical protein